MTRAESGYGLGTAPGEGIEVPGPVLEYLPPKVAADIPIGVIGCGGISERHLAAYARAGFRVTSLCDRRLQSAEARRDAYAPGAVAYSDYRAILDRSDVRVVDITTHPEVRAPIIRDALSAGKHVLSQKPFVLDLDLGLELAGLAESRNLLLAVNQNGRWAPHISYLHQAIRHGHVGDVTSLDFSVFWDHGWIAGTPFEDIPDLNLYDFAIHWFDFINLFMDGKRARRVSAATARAAGQACRPPFLASATVEFEHALATLAFDGSVRFGQNDRTLVSGTRGTLISEGPDLNNQEVLLTRVQGKSRPRLSGRWFNDGFLGSMAELLSALEGGRIPSHHARGNLESLALCFAAVASSHARRPYAPWEIRTLEAAKALPTPGSIPAY